MHGFAPKSPADATKFLNGAATPAWAQVKDSDLSTSDITTNNATSLKHGFLPKLSNNPLQALLGDGTWGVLGPYVSDTAHYANKRFWVASTVTAGSDSIEAVASANGLLFAMGSNAANGRIWISETNDKTGISWRASANLTSADRVQSIAFGRSKYVAVSQSSEAWYSTDGYVWTKAAFTGNDTSYVRVVYGQDGFVAVGTNSKIMTSSDGVTWADTRTVG